MRLCETGRIELAQYEPEVARDAVHSLAGEDRPIATALVGPSFLVRQGLTHILGAAAFHVIASASRTDELHLNPELQRQPLLLLAHAFNRLDVTTKQIESFKSEHPSARIAVLADTDEINDIVSLFRAGANACFAWTVTSDVFVRSLELVMLGETIFPDPVLHFIHRRQDREIPADTEGFVLRLSTQEKRILRYLAEGQSNKRIANENKLALATVKVHVKVILQKIAARNRTQAAIWALNNPSQLRD